MAAGAKTSISRLFVWIVLLLLIVGLAGFGATSFGGSVRTLGSVGDTEIELDRYARALQQQIRAFEAETGQRLSFAEAQQFGLDRIVLQQVVALAALEDEAAELGLSVGDEIVRREVLEIPAFQGIDGRFDREAYEFALQNAGQSVAEFEESLRDETARTLLQGAVIAGIQPPDIFVDTLYAFARETRDLSLLRLTRDDLEEPIPAPTDEQIAAYYEANQDAFTLPERKRITYAWVRPDMMLDEVTVDEEQLRRLYDERAAEYNRPERRLVERLVFSNEAAAQAAMDAIAAGETDFDQLVAERGLTLDDVDLGEVDRGDLGEAAEAVFALDSPGIVGPAPSNLGPALFRVNAILAAQEIPFEEVEEELRAEFATDTARRAIEDMMEPVEDLLAGGATLEEIAEETALVRGEILWSPEMAGISGGDIDAYDAFRTAAAEAEEGVFPELMQLADGGVFALRVDEIVPPSVQPLEEVEAEVIQAWETAELQSRLRDLANEVMDAVANGAALEDQPGTLEQEAGVLRDAFLENYPQTLVPAAFELEAGEMEVLATPDGAVLVRVDAVNEARGDTEESAQVKQGVARQTGQGLAQDITAAYASALQARKGIQLNQQAISAVHAQFN